MLVAIIKSLVLTIVLNFVLLLILAAVGAVLLIYVTGNGARPDAEMFHFMGKTYSWFNVGICVVLAVSTVTTFVTLLRAFRK
jgi:hypothetical protein